MKKTGKKKKVATAILSSIGVLTASSKLLYAATPMDENTAPAPSAIPAQVAATTVLSPEITVLPAGDQLKLQQSLTDLQAKYGDDLMNRMVFKYDGGQLKVIGVQEDAEDMSASKPSSF